MTYVEKSRIHPHVDKFQISSHDRCGKSEISFNMCSIYGILLHLKLFLLQNVFFWRFTLFCRKIGLLRFMCFCVEKILAKNSVCGEKNDKYQV